MTLSEQQKKEILEQQAQANTTKRVTSPELEKILYEALPVLDHEFVLRLAVFPGTRLTLHKVELLYPEGWKTVPEGSIQIMPSHGFFDRTGGLILSHRGEQTVHFVSTHEASGGSVTENSVGGIALEATFTKLELGLDPNCKA